MHSPERTCYCINRSDNATITHHSIQKQRTTAKEMSMDSFKCRCKRTSLFSQLLFAYIKNKPSNFLVFYGLSPLKAIWHVLILQQRNYLYLPIVFDINYILSLISSSGSQEFKVSIRLLLVLPIKRFSSTLLTSRVYQ